MAPKAAPKAVDAGAPGTDLPVSDVTFTVQLDAVFFKNLGSSFCTFEWFNKDNEFAEAVSTEKFDAWPGEPDDDRDTVHGTWTKEFSQACSVNWAKACVKSHLKVEIWCPAGAEFDSESGVTKKDAAGNVCVGNVLFSLSQCLMQSEGGYEGDSMRTDLSHPGLVSMKVTVKTDVPPLSEELRSFLNPICLSVVAAKELPIHEDIKELKQVFCVVKSTDEKLQEACPGFTTQFRQHARSVRWDYASVWLLGLIPKHDLRYFLQHSPVKVELHDRDLFHESQSHCSDEDPNDAEGKAPPREPIDAHGMAMFSLEEFLQPNIHKLRMRKDLVPARANSKVLHYEQQAGGVATDSLLTTDIDILKKKLGGAGREFATPFLQRGSLVILSAHLAVPPEKSAVYRQEDETKLLESLVENETEVVGDGDSGAKKRVDADKSKKGKKAKGKAKATVEEAIDAPAAVQAQVCVMASPLEKDGDKQAFRVKATLGDQTVYGPWRHTKAEADKDVTCFSVDNPDLDTIVRDRFATVVVPVEDSRFERFGRVVLVLDYRKTTILKKIIGAVHLHNMKAMGLEDGPSRAVSTMLLNEEQQNNPHLDILTGFVIIDRKFRIVVVEGLRDYGLQAVIDCFDPRQYANTEKCKVIYNQNIGYRHRLYGKFNLVLKQVKLRRDLDKLVMRPSLYDETKTDLEITKVLNCLMEMRTAQLQSHLDSTGYPTAEQLRTIETLYGDFLSDQEIAGGMAPDWDNRSAKSKQSRASTTLDATAKTSDEDQEDDSDASEEPDVPEVRLPKKRMKEALDQSEPDRTAVLNRTRSCPNFKATNKQLIRAQSEWNTQMNRELGKRMPKDTSFLQAGEPVYIYSGQKLNCTEQQKVAMRSSIKHLEGVNAYTYSPTYSSLQFPLVDDDEAKKAITELRADHVKIDGKKQWKYPPAPDKEHFKKMPRDLGPARGDELKSPWIEHEWFPIPRRSFFPLPPGERPFDPAAVHSGVSTFGPATMFESVHSCGEKFRLQTIADNKEEVARQTSKIFVDDPNMYFWNPATRYGTTSTDRMEQILHGEPKRPGINFTKRYKKKMPNARVIDRKYNVKKPENIKQNPVSIHDRESWNEESPNIEFQARCRENDGEPPYNVATDKYVPRSHDWGSKRSWLIGDKGPAPWRTVGRHCPGLNDKLEIDRAHYVDNFDFERYKKAPMNVHREDYLHKNPHRRALSHGDIARQPNRWSVKRQRQFGIAGHSAAGDQTRKAKPQPTANAKVRDSALLFTDL